MNNQKYLIKKVIKQAMQLERQKWESHCQWAEQVFKGRREIIKIHLKLHANGWMLDEDGVLIKLKDEEKNDKFQQIVQSDKPKTVAKEVYFGGSKEREEIEVRKELKKRLIQTTLEISRNTDIDWTNIMIVHNTDFTEIEIQELSEEERITGEKKLSQSQ